ncbi:MAG: Omp28-related outer membrane protein [Salibacteraceae bacterium]
MKTLLNLALLLSLGISFTKCDKVETPIPKPEVVIVPPVKDSVAFPIVDSSNINRTYKKTLVEEYTGHKCITCPFNTQLLLDQQAQNKDRMIVVAVHAGGFAEVNEPDYPTDFNTEYGTSIFSHYGLGGHPIPSAIINRRKFPLFDNALIFNGATQFWDEPIDEENSNTETAFGLGLAVDYIDSLGLFYIQASIEAQTTISSEHRLLLLCLEDSIVAEQLDGRVSTSEYPKKIVTDYVHRHVLRGKVTTGSSIFGDVIIKSGDGVQAGEWIDFQLNASIPNNVLDINKTSIVAAIINSETEEIVQSEEVHVHVK